MRNIHAPSRSSQVTALFADRALSFALPKGATLQDLAERLGRLDGRHPTTIVVRLHS
jgi:hypothetical protein